MKATLKFQLTLVRMAKIIKQMPTRASENAWKIYSLVVAGQTDTATGKTSVGGPQKTEIQSVRRSSYSTFEHMPTGLSTPLQRHLSSVFIAVLLRLARNRK